MYNPLASRLLKLRKEILKLSQVEIAKTIEIDSGQYSKIERGLLNLTLDHFFKLTEEYKVSPTWLLIGKGGTFLGEEVGEGDSKPVGVVTERDIYLLEGIVEAFEKGCQEFGLDPTPEQKGKLVAKLFQYYKLGEEETGKLYKIDKREVMSKILKFAS